jgi:hypothetical protein
MRSHPIRRESNSQTPRHAYPLYSLHKPAISSVKTPIIIPTIKRSEAKQSKEIRNVVTPPSLSLSLIYPSFPSSEASTSRPEHRRAEKRTSLRAEQSPEVLVFCFLFSPGRNARRVLNHTRHLGPGRRRRGAAHGHARLQVVDAVADEGDEEEEDDDDEEDDDVALHFGGWVGLVLVGGVKVGWVCVENAGCCCVVLCCVVM